jgi:hypothetical protein
MQNKFRLILSLLLLSTYTISCRDQKAGGEETRDQLKRTIIFSGYEWTAIGSGGKRISPGQNYYSCSEENVWVDTEGNLHLKIVRKNNKWYCANIALNESYGFGKYVFQLSSKVNRFDKNVVGGLFTYLDDMNEVDIEFSRWGVEENMNSQFTVQPAYRNGNLFRYNLNLRNKRSTHIIDWQKERIDFVSYRGHYIDTPDKRRIISEWSYSGDNIPNENEEKVMINLWLFNGTPPSDSREVEMIIKAFRIL